MLFDLFHDELERQGFSAKSGLVVDGKLAVSSQLASPSMVRESMPRLRVDAL